jgi:hypothetical protein
MVKPWDARARERFEPLPGLGDLWSLTHGFTVGYYLPRLRRFRKKINLDAVNMEV